MNLCRVTNLLSPLIEQVLNFILNDFSVPLREEGMELLLVCPVGCFLMTYLLQIWLDKYRSRVGKVLEAGALHQ